MKSMLTIFFMLIVLGFPHISCDLGLEIKDPLADRGAFDVTITEWRSEVRIIAGRERIVKTFKDSVYVGEDVLYTYSNGVINAFMKNEEFGMTLRLIGGVEGHALRGEYDVVEYDGQAPAQENKFYGAAETESEEGTVSYLSEEGILSIAMYRPQQRLGANFKFRAHVTSGEENTNVPDSVTFKGAFNAMFQSEE